MADIRQFPHQRRPQPFEVVYPVNLEGKEPEPIRWLVRNAIPRGTVCLFSGDSGLGKSLLMQQLQTCAAIKRNWLNFEVEPVRSFGFYCEDPDNVLHLRQAALCEHYGIAKADLEDMSWSSRVGLDNILMDFNRRTDEGRTTPVYDQIKAHVADFGAQLVVIDTLAHTFNGNENIRAQVTGFVSALQRMASDIDGAVVLTAHPSVSSMISGTGYSGSTAWRATVRAHMYLKRPKGYDDEADDADHETRVIKTMKSNWGPGSGSTKIRYSDGAFVPQEEERIIVSGTIEKLTLERAAFEGIEYLVKSGDKVASGHQHRNAAEVMLSRLPSCKNYRRADLAAAIDRLLESEKIVVVELGPPSRRYTYLRPAHLRYPGEQEP